MLTHGTALATRAAGEHSGSHPTCLQEPREQPWAVRRTSSPRLIKFSGSSEIAAWDGWEAAGQAGTSERWVDARC